MYKILVYCTKNIAKTVNTTKTENIANTNIDEMVGSTNDENSQLVRYKNCHFDSEDEYENEYEDDELFIRVKNANSKRYVTRRRINTRSRNKNINENVNENIIKI